MNTPLVTVVIPTYRRPEQIRRAINSVICQTYDKVEIIVVDDNGKGEENQLQTARNLLEYKDKVNYIVHENNMGGSAARNTGWRATNGKYILFLDDDDTIDERKIEYQVKALDQKDHTWGACYSAYHVIMPSGKIQRSNTKKSGNVYLQTLMRTFYICGGSNLLIRKESVDEIGGYDESFKRNQDIEFLARLSEKYKLLYVDKDLLTIHLEADDREKRFSYEFYEEVTSFYLEKFKSRIDDLPRKDKRRVLKVISLERARVALQYRKLSEAIKMIYENHVGIYALSRYFLYLCRRLITGQTYGFYM